MEKAIVFDFKVDKENSKINVKRSFNAPLELVWHAWTDPEILDLWWAPKPYKVVTKALDFKVGGQWHYLMSGPEGEKQWCLFDYEGIHPFVDFSGIDAFCDEHRVINDTKPRVKWKASFSDNQQSTDVNIELEFEKLEDLKAIIQMGFKEGFTAGLQNLDQYISTQFYLRKKNKQNNLPRVSSYVNFPGQTEEAFMFYKGVFKTDFVNGIQRFGDLPQDPSQPAIAENVKKMVIHVELPLIGGHLLMGTDSPKEMGFEVSTGNHMHIQLEPETKAEADRIFTELSAGGKIEMPMQDMFWGAYFGSFTDRFGINWIINFQTK